MKILFIESKQKNLKLRLNPREISKLPKNLFLAYTMQYKDIARLIKEKLQDNKINIIKFQQILGCSRVNTKLPILLIGTGRFHANNLFLQAPAIYVFENNKITKIPEFEINKIKQKRKTALIKFLRAEKIGILVSTKPGQENLSYALKIKQRIEKKEKKAYIFLSNNIDIGQFENFAIDSWVNTACSGLSMDNSNIINTNELPKY